MIDPLGIHRFPPFRLVLCFIITRTSETKTVLHVFNRNDTDEQSIHNSSKPDLLTHSQFRQTYAQ